MLKLYRFSEGGSFMPIYEYKCSTCDMSFEERQGFDADPVCACPQCQNEARRQFRPAPIIFKGSGFYVTDYPSGASSTLKSSTEETKSEPVAAATSETNSTSSTSTDE